MSVAKVSSAEDQNMGAPTWRARDELVEALLRESREELERIDLKASILLSVCSLALAALVHAAAYLHWDPRDLVGFQWFLWAGMALGACALVALAACVAQARAWRRGRDHLLRPRRTIRGPGRAERRPRQRGFQTRDAFGAFSEATARAQQNNLR